MRLPVLTNAPPRVSSGKVVYITGLPQASADDAEAFHLKVDGNTMRISGGKRGILYGAYELLETYGGIGWYASWRTVVPKAEQLAVPADLDNTQRPAFLMRGRGWRDARHHPDFACRLRLNGGWPGNEPEFQFTDRHGGTGWRQSGGGHSLARLLPASVYGKTHPEYFAEIGGVRYVDDSKATSLAALAAGVEMCGGPVRLIAGGLAKGDNPKTVIPRLRSTVKKVYLIGRCADQFLSAWREAVPCEACETLDRAVAAARRDAVAGETVLLSPGAASFDQFESYGVRGDAFASFVCAEARRGEPDTTKQGR